VVIHAGGVGPVGLFAFYLDLTDGGTSDEGLMQAGEDILRHLKL
jgi:hypothetical protein